MTTTQDRFPDWQRLWQGGDFVFGTTPFLGLPDPQVFPGYDENSDFISDFNQNDNTLPDYDEPFVRYGVDAPEFLFGVDMNNNGSLTASRMTTWRICPIDRTGAGGIHTEGVHLNDNVKMVGGSDR